MRFLPAFSLLLAGCSTLPHHRSSGGIEIRASTAPLADELQSAVPRALAALESLPERVPVDGIVVEAREISGTNCNGHARRGSIDIHYSSQLLREEVNGVCFTLTHELVHASLTDAWHALPACVEDGIADAIAFVSDPRFKPLRVADYNELVGPLLDDKVMADEFRRDLEVDRSTYLAMDRDRRNRLVALGYTLVARIGLGDLQDLVQSCRAAGVDPIPMSRVFELARDRSVPIEDLPLVPTIAALNKVLPEQSEPRESGR
jgi:hypothetical protein